MITAYFNKRFDKWLQRRIPATKKITLHRKNLFIFPSKMGIHFLVSCFILFLLGTNYQNNLILFLVFFLCSFMLTCLLLSYRNVANLQIVAIDNKAQFAGQDCPFHLRLKKPKNSAQVLHFSFQSITSKLQASSEGDSVIVYARATKRGYFNPGRITVCSTFPFGLYKVWTHIDFGLEVLLYPQPVKNRLKVQSCSQNKRANNSYKSMLGVDQFSTLKRYQPGESLKSVAWKQLAQGRGWLSKQFEQSAGQALVFDITALRHLALETRLSFLCYHIIEQEKNQQRYALTLLNQKIESGSGNAHKLRCLQALALFDSDQGER